MSPDPEISGEELVALSKKYISEKDIRKSVKDPIFKEFLRIILLFSSSAALHPGMKNQFGHTFIMTSGKTGGKVEVTFDVDVQSRELQ